MAMRLDFFDLTLFLNIVETGSLTKGAERSAISLQAASERIKKLEQQFSVSLFTRHATGVKLTLAGQMFNQHAQTLIQQHQQLEQAMQPFSQRQHRSMTLWCNSSAQSEYLPLVLPAYLMENPHLHIELQEAESNDIIQALSKGIAQLGLISSFFNAHPLQTLEFAVDPLVLICPRHHPLTHHQSIEAQAKLLGYSIQYRLRLPNFGAIAQVVANGIGIAIIPKRAAQRLQQLYAFQQIQLKGAWANRKLLLAAQNFDTLTLDYQHFSQYLIQQRPQLDSIPNTIND